MEFVENTQTSILNNFKEYYIFYGIFVLCICLYLAYSKHGKIRLGNNKEHSTLSWYAMIFTSTMAADILFFALHEWTYYTSSGYFDKPNSITEQSYTLLHWGFVPWAFYILPACIYAFYKHTKNKKCNKFSDTLDKRKIFKIFDFIGILAIILAVSSTFSFCLPLLSSITKLSSETIILLICSSYFIVTLMGIKFIEGIAKLNYALMFTLLGYCFIQAPQFIVQNSIESIGNLFQNFIGMSTFISKDSFTQDYTVFYYAYWIAWSVATPFFIAKISKGRTIKEMIIGSFIAGVGSTFIVFSIISNMSIYVKEKFNLVTDDPYNFINSLLEKIPCLSLILCICMFLFFISTLDCILYVINKYFSTKKKYIGYLWIIPFTALPIYLLHNDAMMSTLKGLSIISALPLSIIYIYIVYVFFKNLRNNKTDVIILAAGDSSRFNSSKPEDCTIKHKMLCEINGETLISRLINFGKKFGEVYVVIKEKDAHYLKNYNDINLVYNNSGKSSNIYSLDAALKAGANKNNFILIDCDTYIDSVSENKIYSELIKDDSYICSAIHKKSSGEWSLSVNNNVINKINEIPQDGESVTVGIYKFYKTDIARWIKKNNSYKYYDYYYLTYPNKFKNCLIEKAYEIDSYEDYKVLISELRHY